MKIVEYIKYHLCKHNWKIIDITMNGNEKYWTYRCSKCGKIKKL